MSWPVTTIDDIKSPERYSCVGGPFGSDLTGRDYVSEGVPVIRGSNLPAELDFLDDGFVFVSAEKAAALRANTAAPGDLVFTQRGTLGQVGLIPLSARFPEYVISQSQMKLRVDPSRVDPRFLYYFFRHPNTVQQVISRAITSGVPHINLSILKAFCVPCPPLRDQFRVVSVLASFDNLIANNRRRMALLEQAARLIYEEWFVRLRFPGHDGVRVVDGVPEGWARVAIPDVAETIGGGTPSTSVEAYWQDGDIEWVTPTDVTKNRHYVLTSAERTITAAGLAASSAKLLPKHAILMSSRASIGYFAIPGREVCTNQGFIAVVCHKEEFWPYLLMQLSSRVEEIRSLGTGTTFLEVSKGKFRNLQVVRPSDPVVAAYARAVTPFFDQVRKLKQQNEVLVRARDLLLPRLMSGEVVV